MVKIVMGKNICTICNRDVTNETSLEICEDCIAEIEYHTGHSPYMN